MSKVDAQRALRDARYARFAAAKVATPVKKQAAPEAQLVELFAVEPTPEPEPQPLTEPEPEPEPEVASVESSEEPCGHRSIAGRSCTREKGHPQKNHRYA